LNRRERRPEIHRLGPDSKRLVSGHWNKTLKIWDVKSGYELQTLRGHKESVTSAAFSRDGKMLVTGSADDKMKIWNAATGKELRTIDPENEYDVNAVAFSPDGKRVVSGDGENNVKLWDANTGKEVELFEGHEATVTSVAFTPRWQTHRLWQHGHVTAIAFSPDGQRVVSGSKGVVRIWSTPK